MVLGICEPLRHFATRLCEMMGAQPLTQEAGFLTFLQENVLLSKGILIHILGLIHLPITFALPRVALLYQPM